MCSLGKERQRNRAAYQQMSKDIGSWFYIKEGLALKFWCYWLNFLTLQNQLTFEMINILPNLSPTKISLILDHSRQTYGPSFKVSFLRYLADFLMRKKISKVSPTISRSFKTTRCSKTRVIRYFQMSWISTRKLMSRWYKTTHESMRANHERLNKLNNI